MINDTNKENSLTIQLTDTLDNAVYKYPVTIRRPLPMGWQAAKVTQNEKTSDASIVEADSEKYIMFDVIPDAGEIVLSSVSK